MGPVIIAIESSCDETSASVIKNGEVLNNIIYSQDIHQKYGGVVPELASRAHQQYIVPVVEKSLNNANIRKSRLDAVAFTQGPGLLGSLLVGASFAKGLALALNIPLIEVHHMQAHVLSHFIDDPKPKFPFLCLTVSGGHTQIVKVNDYLEMEILGQTKDDAVGEAFDKAAKILGIPYPGGPLIDKYGARGDPLAFSFPDTSVPELDFSFSGIKTAILYFVRENTEKDAGFVKKNLNDICASIQNKLVGMLIEKLVKASEHTGINEIAIAGGVAANSYLRDEISRVAGERRWKTYVPEFEYCTDNAAMIAITAHYKYLNKQFTDMSSIPQARLPMV